MNENPSYVECRERLFRAGRAVPVGSVWRHYKGSLYLIEGINLDSTAFEPRIGYRPTEQRGVSFSRLMSEWFEVIPLESGRSVPRYISADKPYSS